MATSDNQSISSPSVSDNNVDDDESTESLSSQLFYMTLRNKDNKNNRDYKCFSVLKSHCIPCDESHLQPCHYGARDCLFAKLKIVSQGQTDFERNTIYYIAKKKTNME